MNVIHFLIIFSKSSPQNKLKMETCMAQFECWRVQFMSKTGCLTFSISLGMLLLLWFTISSSYRRGGLPNGRFRSPGYHLTSARIHLLFANFVTCSATRNFYFRYSAIKSFTSL